MTLIDMNCDMGEGFGVYTLGDDVEMLRTVTSQPKTTATRAVSNKNRPKDRHKRAKAA